MSASWRCAKLPVFVRALRDGGVRLNPAGGSRRCVSFSPPSRAPAPHLRIPPRPAGPLPTHAPRAAAPALHTHVEFCAPKKKHSISRLHARSRAHAASRRQSEGQASVRRKHRPEACSDEPLRRAASFGTLLQLSFSSPPSFFLPPPPATMTTDVNRAYTDALGAVQLDQVFHVVRAPAGRTAAAARVRRERRNTRPPPPPPEPPEPPPRARARPPPSIPRSCALSLASRRQLCSLRCTFLPTAAAAAATAASPPRLAPNRWAPSWRAWS